MDLDEQSQLNHPIGRYRIVASLGQGGMGTIWLAVAGGLGEFRKLLVVKELRQDLTRNQRFVQMFLDEAKLAARLTHPNVVHTLEAGQDGERYFLSMEFLDGQPLSEVLQCAATEPRISLPIRLRILCDVLSGLHYAHELRDYDGTELQIVHRDISPQNVFVTYDGQVKVVDFGIAKAADAGNVTQPGVFKGRLAYAAPEQVKGQPADRRADVFSVGVMLWEMVSLRRFAKGKATPAAVDARLAGREPRLRDIAPELDPLLCEICERALQLEPAQRFDTAEQFRAALEQYLLLSGERVEAGAIAVVMQSVFERQRAEMHRTIDTRLKESDFSESIVRRLRPLPSAELSDDDPTKVVDLSELVESSRSAAVAVRSTAPSSPSSDAGDSMQTDGFGRALRGSSRKRSAAVLAFFALILGLWMMTRTPVGSSTASTGAGDASGRKIETATMAATEARPAAEANGQAAGSPGLSANGAEPPRPTLPQVWIDPETQHAASADPAKSARVRRREGDAPAPRQAYGVARDGRATTTANEPSAERSAWATARVSAAEPASAEESVVDSPSQRSSASSPAAIQETGPAAGSDLHQMQRAARRKLDLEDPFQ